MFFHWLIALLIITTFIFGSIMVDIPGITPNKLRYYSWHKWIGISIFGLTCLRLLWRLTHTPPEFPLTLPVWQKKAASGLHVFLYLLIFGIPLSGYLFSLASGIPIVYLGIFPMPIIINPNPELKPLLKELHYVLNMALLISFGLHVLAALKHQFVDRDGIISRIVP
ncbi:MAG: cytochrome b561 family protein [Solimicrobium sp.]|nr:cytochrome b561 family protein [Solimicrobium sp.]